METPINIKFEGTKKGSRPPELLQHLGLIKEAIIFEFNLHKQDLLNDEIWRPLICAEDEVVPPTPQPLESSEEEDIVWSYKILSQPRQNIPSKEVWVIKQS
ncbi:UDP-N-acetylmuramoyl-L-alanine--D-glutamate ligase [Sesbania bispinosa]|nr:UDP-N-acetylmuramoyl-L-alanine--D-glutamate ligase [Sesbania bispinosa]